MKIKALDTYFLSAPLPQPVRTSTSTISRVSELIVRLTTDSGLVGIGEAHGTFLSQGGPEAMRSGAKKSDSVSSRRAAPGRSGSFANQRKAIDASTTIGSRDAIVYREARSRARRNLTVRRPITALGLP